MVRTKSCWTRSTRDRQSVLERRQKEIVWPGGTSSSWAITRRHVALSFIDRRRERLNECVFLSEREWRADRKAESFAAPCFIVCERQLASEGAPLYATLRKIKRSLSLSARRESERNWKTEKNVGNSRRFDPPEMGKGFAYREFRFRINRAL